MSTAALRRAWNEVLKELQPPFSPEYLRLCEALSNLFAECGNTLRMHGGSSDGLLPLLVRPSSEPVPAVTSGVGSATPPERNTAIPRVDSAPLPERNGGVIDGPIRRQKAKSRLLTDTDGPRKRTARASPYQRPVLTRFSAQFSTGHPKPQARISLAALILRLKNRVLSPGKVIQISTGNQTCLIQTSFGEEVLVDPRDDTKAYIAFDTGRQLQFCFPESPADKLYALENAPRYVGAGKSPSDNYLWYRRGFETTEAVKIAVPSHKEMLQNFEINYKGKDPQYNNIRHLSDDTPWIAVENIVAVVPKKLWSADKTLDPAAVYEGLLFNSIW